MSRQKAYFVKNNSNNGAIIRRIIILLIIGVVIAACDARPTPVVERVTVVALNERATAPIYTDTPTFTPSYTPTQTHTPTITPTETPTLTSTPTQTPSITPTGTLPPTATFTPPATFTPSPMPTSTPPLMTQTPVTNANPPANIATATFSEASGWSCGDFPCADDVSGFLSRINVPVGFNLSHVGRFPGQVMQIAYGPDGRLYATVLEDNISPDGAQTGAVYAMNADGSTERYSYTLVMPLGLAFQPGTDVLYVSSRNNPAANLNPDGEPAPERGVLWRILSDRKHEIVRDDLPCCFDLFDNQPNGMIFGNDGYLYMGIGSLTDFTESGIIGNFAIPEPLEASIVRINPHTGAADAYARGIRNPFDVAMTRNGQLYTTDTGLLSGPGDRLLAIDEGVFYGWPYYRTRGCADCPALRASQEVAPDLLTLPAYTLPRGIVAYRGAQFPSNMDDTLFVALWNGTDWAQRVVWIDPNDPALQSEDYEPQPFVTGLIRPIDVAISPDGALIVADFTYGHIWRVSYGNAIVTTTSPTIAPNDVATQEPVTLPTLLAATAAAGDETPAPTQTETVTPAISETPVTGLITLTPRPNVPRLSTATATPAITSTTTPSATPDVTHTVTASTTPSPMPTLTSTATVTLTPTPTSGSGIATNTPSFSLFVTNTPGGN